MNRAGPALALERWGCVDVEVRFRDRRSKEWGDEYTVTVRHELFRECMEALGFVTVLESRPVWFRRVATKEG